MAVLMAEAMPIIIMVTNIMVNLITIKSRAIVTSSTKMAARTLANILMTRSRVLEHSISTKVPATQANSSLVFLMASD